MWPTRERPSSQLDKHGRSCMGKKEKKRKIPLPFWCRKNYLGKKLVLTSKKKKKIKDKFKKIQDGGSYYIGALLFVPRKGWKKSWMEERGETTTENGHTKTRTGNPWITNDEFIFVGTKSYATVDDFEGLENSFRIPGGPLAVCWNFTRGSLTHLVFPDSVENIIIYICVFSTNFPLSKYYPPPSVPFYLSTRVFSLEIDPTWLRYSLRVSILTRFNKQARIFYILLSRKKGRKNGFLEKFEIGSRERNRSIVSGEKNVWKATGVRLKPIIPLPLRIILEYGETDFNGTKWFPSVSLQPLLGSAERDTGSGHDRIYPWTRVASSSHDSSSRERRRKNICARREQRPILGYVLEREREREGNERPKQMIYRACFGYHLGQLEKFTRFGHGSFRFFLSPSTKDKMANERCKRVR